MPQIALLLVRYFLGTVSLVTGVIFVPLPIPLGVPLILIAITLFAGSTKPVKRLLARLRGAIKRRWARAQRKGSVVPQTISTRAGAPDGP